MIENKNSPTQGLSQLCDSGKHSMLMMNLST